MAGTINATGAATAVSSTNAQNTISLYPNPATEALRVDFGTTGHRKILILDVTGHVLAQHDLTASATVGRIDISGLPEGLYILRTEINNTIVTKTFTIAR
jgi:hypothetical protein